MARSVTVIIQLAGTASTAGVELKTQGTIWTKSEPGSADVVFKTKRGTYRKVGSRTELLRPSGGFRVGVLENFDPDTIPDKATGKGLSDDAGQAINWKVDGIT